MRVQEVRRVPQGHSVKALRKTYLSQLKWFLSFPLPASHPRLCKEPGDVCVSGGWKQSGPPGPGREGQECGGAEGLEGGDPVLPGVVTLEAAAAPATQRAEGTRGYSLDMEAFPRLGGRNNSGLALEVGGNTPVPGRPVLWALTYPRMEES